MIMMPLMRYWNSLKENDIYGYRGKKDNNLDFVYYHNKSKNEYYCNRIIAHDALVQKYKNVFILTNSMSYYNKYKNQYPVRFVEYFYYDDYVINQKDKIDTIYDPNTTCQIINDFLLIFLYFFSKNRYMVELGKIVSRGCERNFIIPVNNTYLNKSEAPIEQVYRLMDSVLLDECKIHTKQHRALAGHNYVIDLPLDDSDLMRFIPAISFYPFHFKKNLQSLLIYVSTDNYKNNIDTYDYLIRKKIITKVKTPKCESFEIFKVI